MCSLLLHVYPVETVRQSLIEGGKEYVYIRVEDLNGSVVHNCILEKTPGLDLRPILP